MNWHAAAIDRGRVRSPVIRGKSMPEPLAFRNVVIEAKAAHDAPAPKNGGIAEAIGKILDDGLAKIQSEYPDADVLLLHFGEGHPLELMPSSDAFQVRFAAVRRGK